MNAPRGKFVLVTAGIATVFALAGCSAGAPESSASAPPPVESQTQSEACLILQDAVSESTAELQSAFSELQADPAAAVEKIDAVAQALDGGASSVTNEDVKAAAEQARDSLKEMVALLKDGVADPTSFDLAALQDVATQVQNDFSAIGKTCS